MNNYVGEKRLRHKTLLIVEGNHEKDKLFRLIFQCFPEINIDMDNVWVYGTNIYILYNDIVKEYGLHWSEEKIDIDLPFVISKKKNFNQLQYKDDFTNIILVFDYERHDINFSERKILEMQNSFLDMTDMGKLYINYPMIESYQHLKSIPDIDYAERKIPVSFQPGKKYKGLVKKETIIDKIVCFPHRIDDLLNEYFGITDTEIRQECCKKILELSEMTNLEENLQFILQDTIVNQKLKTSIYQLKDWIMKVGYINTGQTYWQYMRYLFIEIVYHNICKANRIQNNQYDIEMEQYKECFYNLELAEILKIQNMVSQSKTNGYIWVLNTCIFIIADYNFKLIQKDNQKESLEFIEKISQ